MLCFNCNVNKMNVKVVNMKIIYKSEPRVIMANPSDMHNYFAWPTVARLQDGRIAVAASGFRLRHICPFGKTVIAFSEDNGETYSRPVPVIDTVLDDRDGGLMPFGKSSLVVTSFNNRVSFQRQHAKSDYDTAYLDSVTEDAEQAALGANFRISHDGGKSFGPILKSPVTSPHGPTPLPDGTALWLGNPFGYEENADTNRIEAHRLWPDGHMEYMGTVPKVPMEKNVYWCEPHGIALEDGRILVHIRVQNYKESIFTLFQSESCDLGKTWSEPRQLLHDCDGAPGHLLQLNNGALLCVYSFRGNPYGTAPYAIKGMVSTDGGKTWDANNILFEGEGSRDMGYPSTVELPNGDLLTVFYARPGKDEPAVIWQIKWRMSL